HVECALELRAGFGPVRLTLGGVAFLDEKVGVEKTVGRIGCGPGGQSGESRQHEEAKSEQGFFHSSKNLLKAHAVCNDLIVASWRSKSPPRKRGRGTESRRWAALFWQQGLEMRVGLRPEIQGPVVFIPHLFETRFFL